LHLTTVIGHVSHNIAAVDTCPNNPMTIKGGPSKTALHCNEHVENHISNDYDLT
jgi:hypothetical protein